MSFTSTARQTIPAVALALVAVVPSVAVSRTLVSTAAARQVSGVRTSRTSAHSRLALPPQVIARLRPGRSLYGRQAHGGMLPDSAYTHTSVVFGSDYGANQIDVFKQSNLANVAVINDATPHACNSTSLNEPQGMWVDHARNLWVADAGNGDVREYPLGQTTSSVSLADLAGATPVDVAVDSNVTGKVYATNAFTGSPGNIVGWSPSGNTFNCGQTPNIVLGDPTFQWVYFLSTDGAGDLYVDYIDWNFSPRVCFIAAPIPANDTAVCTGTAGNYVSNVALQFPGGIQVLPASATNRVTIVDQMGAGSLGVGYYNTPLPAFNGGAPAFVIDPPAAGSWGPFADPVTSSIISANGKKLWASDATTVPGGALLRIRKTTAYPAGQFTAEISGFSQLMGTAVSPSLSP